MGNYILSTDEQKENLSTEQGFIIKNSTKANTRLKRHCKELTLNTIHRNRG